ncbi:chromatin-remodeling complex atpase chain isw-1 [Pyrenophora seminiperda CCB06]|uniref:Chromatin-remodeling complex atpase chain isw-1 n=1 Tax=Pyrenophora seminiperda CCB06 TaxID=1302712 RepID=A0A3M7M947_9PLEO|nr:chromatin-remodeling complex atpase chain isw-1 [Pyrenophora seminiperda CCB06]
MELAGWMKDIYQLPPVANSDEKDEPQPHDYPPVHPSQPGAFVEIIDLGSPSVSSGDEVVMPGDAADIRRRSSTPDSIITESVEPIIATHPELISAAIPVNHTDESQLASISTIRRCLLADLIEYSDRKRVVSKAISKLRADDRELIRNRVQLIGKMASTREITACVDMLWSGESKLRGVLPRDMPKILVFVNLFLSWWFCRDYLKGPKASKADLADLKLSIEDGSAKMDVFYDYVHTVMGTTFSEKALQHPERPSQAEIIEISDDDD